MGWKETHPNRGEQNAAFAGMTLEVSFTRLSVSMAAFSEERVPSCLSGRWDLVAMVETKGGCGEVVRGAGHEEESGP